MPKSTKPMCDCGKSTCILKSDSTFKFFEDNKRLLFESNHGECKKGGPCRCATVYTDYSNSQTSVSNVDFDFDINGSKCKMVKQMISMKYDMKRILQTNRAFFNNQDKLNKQVNLFSETNKKIKNSFTNALNDLMETKRTICKTKIQLFDARYEVQILKKKNKQLEKLLIDDSDSDDNDEDDDESTDSNDDNQLVVNVEPIAQTVVSKDDDKQILTKYQQLVKYMDNYKISLSGIIRRNNISGDVRNSIYQKFINLRIDRNEIAHPEIIMFESDQSFIQCLL
jgi:hypothetical protein